MFYILLMTISHHHAKFSDASPQDKGWNLLEGLKIVVTDAKTTRKTYAVENHSWYSKCSKIYPVQLVLSTMTYLL